MVAEGEWAGLRTEDLDPRSHMTAERSREREWSWFALQTVVVQEALTACPMVLLDGKVKA